jgi:hypothetical protein
VGGGGSCNSSNSSTTAVPAVVRVMGEAALEIAAIVSFFVNAHKKPSSFPKFYISVTAAYRERERESRNERVHYDGCV